MFFGGWVMFFGGFLFLGDPIGRAGHNFQEPCLLADEGGKASQHVACILRAEGRHLP